jgi:predicted house-cleaning noncanonical NTP pyrophosphatase (MazG superfamily)
MKLVRDHVPGLGAGLLREALVTEYEELFEAKLVEEYRELLATMEPEESTEELADLMQILYDLCSRHGVRVEHVAQRRASKYASHGGFRRMLVLDEARSGHGEQVEVEGDNR